jgi:hypothetical protein
MICGIKADGQVGHGNVAQHTRHRGRGLLTGLHQEVLSIPLAMLRNFANGLYRARVQGIGGIFWDESTMGLHLRDAE